jgi:hypothetical protein
MMDDAGSMRGGGPLKKRPRSPPAHEDADFEPMQPSKRRTTMTEYFAANQGCSSTDHTQSTTSTSSSSCGTSEESSDCETEEASNKLMSVTDNDRLTASRERNRVHAQV